MGGVGLARADLFRPVDIASLAAFRIAFGLCALAGPVRYLAYGWVDELYVKPRIWFTYEGFDWVTPWPAPWMHVHYAVLALCALAVALGFAYRAAIVSYFVLFTYVELLDKTSYLNHYYLVSLLAFGLIFLPAHRAWSVDAWLRPSLRSDTTAAWTVWALRAQIGLVYVFAGVAKLHPDWLSGTPLDIWLAARADFPVIGPILAQPWLPPLMAVAGCLYDLTIPFFLLWRRTRWVAYALILGFHTAVGSLFNIGVFPWIMVGLTPIFFDPGWPRALVPRLRKALVPGPVRRPRWVAPVLLAWFALQLAIPLRSWAWGGDVRWHEQGFRFSWRFLLVEKRGHFTYRVVDPADGAHWTVYPQDWLTERQRHQASFAPDMLLHLAHLLHDDKAREGRDVQVFCDAWVSMNGARSERLIDPDVDLAHRPRSWLRGYDWVTERPEVLSRPGRAPMDRT